MDFIVKCAQEFSDSLGAEFTNEVPPEKEIQEQHCRFADEVVVHEGDMGYGPTVLVHGSTYCHRHTLKAMGGSLAADAAHVVYAGPTL